VNVAVALAPLLPTATTLCAPAVSAGIVMLAVAVPDELVVTVASVVPVDVFQWTVTVSPPRNPFNDAVTWAPVAPLAGLSVIAATIENVAVAVGPPVPPPTAYRMCGPGAPAGIVTVAVATPDALVVTVASVVPVAEFQLIATDSFPRNPLRLTPTCVPIGPLTGDSVIAAVTVNVAVAVGPPVPAPTAYTVCAVGAPAGIVIVAVAVPEVLVVTVASVVPVAEFQWIATDSLPRNPFSEAVTVAPSCPLFGLRTIAAVIENVAVAVGPPVPPPTANTLCAPGPPAGIVIDAFAVPDALVVTVANVVPVGVFQ